MAKNEQALKSVWTYRIPHQYVWVEGRLWGHGLDPDCAISILEELNGLVCRVHVSEQYANEAEIKTSIAIETLSASCPFCEEGADQTLQNDQWLYIHDAPSNYARGEIQSLLDSCLDDEWTAKQTVLVKRHLERAFFGFLSDQDEACREEPSEVGELVPVSNPYGISLEEIAAFDPRQQRLTIPDMPLAQRDFGIPDFFAGTYLCPHCGKAFGVVRYGKDAASVLENPSINDILLAKEIKMLVYLSRRLGRSRVAASTVTVTSSESSIVISAPVDGIHHEFMFDTGTGCVRLDGSVYADEGVLRKLFEHPFITSGILSHEKVVQHIASLLPPLPSGITWGDNDHVVCLLLAANRFIGYPASFYDEVTRCEHGGEEIGPEPFFYSTYPIWSGLPRYYTDIEACYALTGLPNKKSLKRLLFSRPTLLFAVMRSFGLPFRKVDILYRFLSMPSVMEWLRGGADPCESLMNWQRLIHAKGESAILRLFMEKSSTEIHSLTKLLGETCQRCLPAELDVLDHTPLHRLELTLKCLLWQADHPRNDLTERYVYSEEQRSLEGAAASYTFVLPDCPRDYLQAADDLHNCMASLACVPAKTKKQTIMLMRKGNRAVAGIVIRSNKMVTEALIACNAPIEGNPDINAAFMAWVEEKGLLIEF